MVDYLEKIDRGLIIEKPKILLPWDLQKKDIFDKINGIKIKVVNEKYYTFKIVLSGISFINCVGLHFEKERLSEVELFNNEEYWRESEIEDVFCNHQLVLESIFGIPYRNKLLEKLKGLNKEYIWKFRCVTMIHKLWDRFGMEENLRIYINIREFRKS